MIENQQAQPMTGSVHIQTDTPQIITIQPFVEEFWFAVMERYVDEIMPHHSGADVKIQVFFFRNRDRQTSIVSDLPQSRIAEVLNLSPGQVSSSIKTLCSVFDFETRRPLLLEPLSRTSWLVAPACRFRGMRLQPAEHQRPPRSAHQTNVQPTERKFGRLNEDPARYRERGRVVETSDGETTTVDESGKRDQAAKTPPAHAQGATHAQPKPCSGKGEKHFALAKAIRIMVSGPPAPSKPGVPKQRGFKFGDAAAIVAEANASVEEIKAAIRNANWMLQSGKLKATWTGYVRSQLLNGVTLFKHLQDEEDNANRVRDRLARLAPLFGTEDVTPIVEAWFYGLDTGRMARLQNDSSWRERDEKFWGACVARAMHAQGVAP